MKEEFVTITGFRNYLGLTPFKDKAASSGARRSRTTNMTARQ